MSFTYDPAGNRKTRTDYNGGVTEYTYDALNRLKTISYPDTATVSYTYDKLAPANRNQRERRREFGLQQNEPGDDGDGRVWPGRRLQLRRQRQPHEIEPESG